MTFFLKISFTAVIYLFTLHLNAQDARALYIEKYRETAIRQMEQFGIPASIILSQAALESANGTSKLATQANNHFGIKCHNWSGKTILHDDDAKNECFRKYNSPEESFMDHSLFLTQRARYRDLFSIDIKDYKGWAMGLSKAGYATNPRYAQLLISIIEKYSLYTLDSKTSYTPPLISKKEESFSHNIPVKRPVYKNNSVQFIITTPYDSYSSIAREFDLFKRELLRFNDIDREKPLEPGIPLYIEKKRRKLKEGHNIHVVSSGESMRSISQQYGIRLRNLYKINNMKKGEAITPGEEIKLR
jgi:LysM repeat protein